MSTVQLPAVDDVTIRTDMGNYRTSLVVGQWSAGPRTCRALVRFDLGSVPTAAAIASATLELLYSGYAASNSYAIGVYRQKRSWVGAQATWSQYASGQSWQTAGGFGASDCEQTAIGQIEIPAGAAYGWKSIALDITAVAEMARGTFANRGFLLRMAVENDAERSFRAMASGESEQPRLTIEYRALSGLQAVVWG